MRAVVQRVARARVVAEGEIAGEIGAGLCVLLGVARGDGAPEAERLAGKVARLRVFEDAEGKFARSVLHAGGSILVVSQFTLLADTRRGRRPSWSAAAPGPVAQPLVEAVVADLRGRGLEVATGVFGADMAVELVNDGPVTILLDTREERGAQGPAG